MAEPEAAMASKQEESAVPWAHPSSASSASSGGSSSSGGIGSSGIGSSSNSSSSSMVQARGAVAPACLLILLLVALQAQGVGAAPWRARELDMAGGNGHPASRLGSRADAQGDLMDMGRGRALPAPRLDPALDLTWHPRGPQRAKYKAETGKRSQQSSEDLKEILKELDKAARELDRETVEEEALQEGGSQAVPVSDEKKGAIQSTGVPGASLQLREPGPTPAATPHTWTAGPPPSATLRARPDTSSHRLCLEKRPASHGASGGGDRPPPAQTPTRSARLHPGLRSCPTQPTGCCRTSPAPSSPRRNSNQPLPPQAHCPSPPARA
ncbi:uncharacterized protein LOC129200873 [Grus americana]|uniref:uncharacterized protein LOC129200873 n=1 Tax=Grus americana TaxID=9117 RepID=UPI0024085B12|nr:uncharacterized protein LOC129200873 [Grus americana]